MRESNASKWLVVLACLPLLSVLWWPTGCNVTPNPTPTPTPTPAPECTVDGDCADGQECDNGECVTAEVTPEDTFPTSLHATRHGKQTFYEAEDGFVTLTNVPYESLPCKDCHGATLANGEPTPEDYAPGCGDCHADPDNPSGEIENATCLLCHSRQGAEQNFGDVHRDMNMNCVDCHTADEMHGDGTEYASFLEEGAMDVECEDCHVEGGQAGAPATSTSHSIHGEKLHCSACHVSSVSTCYNCHFESEVEHVGKRFFNQSPRTGFKMLVNWNNKVHTATFQSLVYEGQTFVAIAPYFGHAITTEDISCDDCHANDAVQAYDETGTIVVTSWDAEGDGADRLVGPSGVIPVPEDWMTALEFAFLDYTGEATDAINGTDNMPLWDYLKTEKDGGHMVYGEPLTADQMDSLSVGF